MVAVELVSGTPVHGVIVAGNRGTIPPMPRSGCPQDHVCCAGHLGRVRHAVAAQACDRCRAVERDETRPVITNRDPWPWPAGQGPRGMLDDPGLMEGEWGWLNRRRIRRLKRWQRDRIIDQHIGWDPA